MENLRKIREEMVAVAEILAELGLFDGFGHITYRLENGNILSTPKMPPGNATVRDIILLSPDGRKLKGAGEPNGETPLHTTIYERRPDVRSIIHYHPDCVVVLASVGMQVKPIVNAGVFFASGTPIYDCPKLVTTREEGLRIAKKLGEHCAVILCGHGAVVVADGVREVGRLAINLEKNAQLQLFASMLGKPRFHSREEAEEIIQAEKGYNAMKRYWDFYLCEKP